MRHSLEKYFQDTICIHHGFEYIPQYADEKLVYLFGDNFKEIQMVRKRGDRECNQHTVLFTNNAAKNTNIVLFTNLVSEYMHRFQTVRYLLYILEHEQRRPWGTYHKHLDDQHHIRQVNHIMLIPVDNT
jgi:hypothetical protein